MIKKNIFTIALLTLISRIFGLIRSILLASFLGTTFIADAFTIAFKIPNLLRRLVAEGSMTAAFLPVFSDVQKESGNDKKKESIFLSKFYSLAFIILFCICLLGIYFTPLLINLIYSLGNQQTELTIFLTRYMFAYLGFISLAAITQSVLNANFKFVIPAINPVILNIAIISSAIFLKDIISTELLFKILPQTKIYLLNDQILLKATKASLAFATGVLIGGVLQLIIQLPLLFKLGYSIIFTTSFKDKYISLIGKLMIPGLFGMGIYQINSLIADPFVLAYLEKGSISALNYSNRLVEFTLGIFVISLSTVILPSLSKSVSNKNMKEYSNLIINAIRLVIFISIPATFGLISLREELITLLFKTGLFDNRSTFLVSQAVLYHSSGLIFIAIYRIYSPAFFALKDTKTPVKGAFISLIVNLILCAILPKYMGIGGIALASSVAALFNGIYLMLKLKKIVKDLNPCIFIKPFYKSLISALIMFTLMIIIKDMYGNTIVTSKIYSLLKILSLTGIGIILYFTTTYLFAMKEVTIIINKIKSKLRG